MGTDYFRFQKQREKDQAEKRDSSQPFLSATCRRVVCLCWGVIAAGSCSHFQFHLGTFELSCQGVLSLLTTALSKEFKCHVGVTPSRRVTPGHLLPSCHAAGCEFSVPRSNVHPEIEQITIFKPFSEFPRG